MHAHSVSLSTHLGCTGDTKCAPNAIVAQCGLQTASSQFDSALLLSDSPKTVTMLRQRVSH